MSIELAGHTHVPLASATFGAIQSLDSFGSHTPLTSINPLAQTHPSTLSTMLSGHGLGLGMHPLDRSALLSAHALQPPKASSV